MRDVQPGPCTRPTKSYTPESMVVFQGEPPPSNYTGQTYRLAAPRKARAAVALFAGKTEQLERFLEVITEHRLSQ
jgi:hypothetical protein